MTETINLDGAHPPPGAYGDRVVGFVDILGFADLVRRADRMPSLRADIVEALNAVRSIASPERTETDLRTQNFSDSLILSANNTANGFWHLLLSIDALAWNLLQIERKGRQPICST